MPHPTAPEPETPRLPAQHIYLIIAIVTGAVIVTTWVVDAITPGASVPIVIYDALSVAAGLAGCGYLVRSEGCHVRHTVGRAYLEGYADGFTDGTVDPSKSVRSIR